MEQYHDEEGVSEMTSTALLIGVTILLVAILTAIFLSGLQPDEIPRAAIYARNESGKFALAHMGGDPLEEGNYRIYIDTGGGLVNATGDFTRPGGGVWSVGESIAYDGTWIPGRVVVTVISGRTEMILAEMGLPGGIGIPTPTETATPTPTPTPEPLEASFTANVTVGNAPLTVQFTDESTGDIATSWSWDFGDGSTSTEQSPVHTYVSAGNYTVKLTVSNTHGSNVCTKSNYIQVTVEEFIDFVVNESVFVYGNVLQFNGNSVTGPGATVVIKGGLKTNDLNGGAFINVSNIYFDGDVTLDGGSASLGSETEPGAIYINGDLNLMGGGRDIYGDVYVSGNLYLKDARIHGNMYVQGKADLIGGEIYGDLHLGGDLYLKGAHTHGDVYVDGNVELDWTPIVDGNIEYTGGLTKPDWYNQSILDKCTQEPYVSEVPSFEMLDLAIPSTKSEDWYTEKGYVSNGTWGDNMKIFSQGTISVSGSANNVIVIASEGNIEIAGGSWNDPVTGVFFAPNGKVTFNGGFLEGVVIASDGLIVINGGSTVTFKNIEKYIANPEDYPF